MKQCDCVKGGRICPSCMEEFHKEEGSQVQDNTAKQTAVEFQRRKMAEQHQALEGMMAEGVAFDESVSPEARADYYRKSYQAAMKQMMANGRKVAQLEIELVPTSEFHAVGIGVGKDVERRGREYGDCIQGSAEMLEVLYPHGIGPHQYGDVLLISRILSKLCLASKGDNTWNDIAGYGIIGSVREQNRTQYEVSNTVSQEAIKGRG